LKALKVAGLFHLQSANMATRLRALLILSYNLAITVLAMNASGVLLAEGARFNEAISRLSQTTFVPKGI